MNPMYTPENNNKINTSDPGIVPLRTAKVSFWNRNTSLTVHLGCNKAAFTHLACSSLQITSVGLMDLIDWHSFQKLWWTTEIYSLLHLCFSLGWCFWETLIKGKQNKHCSYFSVSEVWRHLVLPHKSHIPSPLSCTSNIFFFLYLQLPPRHVYIIAEIWTIHELQKGSSWAFMGCLPRSPELLQLLSKKENRPKRQNKTNQLVATVQKEWFVKMWQKVNLHRQAKDNALLQTDF